MKKGTNFFGVIGGGVNTYTIQVDAEAHAPLDRHTSSALLGGKDSTVCQHLLELRCMSLREAAQEMIKKNPW